MPRRPRLFAPGTLVHVVSRCNNKERLFREPAHFQYFLDLVKTYRDVYGFHFYTYCLMSSHVHLLLAPGPTIPLPEIMRAILHRYAVWFNQQFGRKGHFWESRYLSSLIEEDAYGLACLRYIHLNPVRAGLVAEPGEYRWSGHRFYTGDSVDPLLTPLPSYQALGRSREARQASYREFVAAASDVQSERRTFHRPVVGSQAFLRRYVPRPRGRPHRRAVS